MVLPLSKVSYISCHVVSDIQYYEAENDYVKALDVCNEGIKKLDHWRLYHLKANLIISQAQYAESWEEQEAFYTDSFTTAKQAIKASKWAYSSGDTGQYFSFWNFLKQYWINLMHVWLILYLFMA